ncbi:MAG TPA: YncE family protein [Candidatus Saccharimonadales bacterium]|nr:YncE family protein [Candidatus Saccharimonadales bacterium]
MIRCGRRIVSAAALVAAVAAGPVQANPGYHVLKDVVLGGEGGWDYLTVDAAARRLYITRGTHVMVLDADSCTVVGDIPNTPGVHGVALAPELGRGFTSNGQDSSVTIFDLKTLKELGRVQVGRRPDAIVFDPASGRVFTMNAGSRDATALDAATGKVAGKVVLDGKPEFAAVDGAGKLYVNLEDSSLIRVVDTRGLKVTATWPLAPGEEPSGLALDAQRGRLFSTCGNQKLVVVGTEDGKVLASLPIGKGVDAGAFEPSTGKVFTSNGEGTLTVAGEVAPGKFEVRETVTTKPGARTMALDPKTHRVFTVTAQFGPAPAPTAEHPRPRRPMLPGTFELLVLGE